MLRAIDVKHVDPVKPSAEDESLSGNRFVFSFVFLSVRLLYLLIYFELNCSLSICSPYCQYACAIGPRELWFIN